MSANAATYGPDIVIALVSTATFGGWGLAGAAVFSLARHSPVVQEGVAQLAPQLHEARRRLPELLSATPHDRALARRPRPAVAPPALFAELEAPPHRLIVGHTGGGKTTLMHHLATAWAAQGQQVVVIDPDAAPGQWPGCTVAGGGDDRDGAARALASVAQVVSRRRAERAQGRRSFPPLHLVIDEAHDVLPDVEGAFDVFEDVARRGRKIGVRLTLGVQDKQVKTLGLEGRSELLRNFVKADIFKARDGRRLARVEDTVTGKHIDHAIPALRDPETLIASPEPRRAPIAADAPRAQVVTVRVPERKAGPAVDLSDLLDELLAMPVPAQQKATERDPDPFPDGTRNDGSHSSVTVGTGTGATVEVNVTQVAGARPAPRNRKAQRGLDMRSRRLRLIYYKAGADGVPFARVAAMHKGTKDIVFPAWQAGRATRKEA